MQQASLTRGPYASERSLRKHRPAYQVVRKPGVDTGLANKTVADTAAIPQPWNHIHLTQTRCNYSSDRKQITRHRLTLGCIQHRDQTSRLPTSSPIAPVASPRQLGSTTLLSRVARPQIQRGTTKVFPTTPFFKKLKIKNMAYIAPM